MMGLVQAAKEIEAQGRGPDTRLAHITPQESGLMDYMQGGRKENPVTGLPEYGLFGKLLKAVARVAATTGGFMVGGPAGAAAANAAATKLTGGSWKQAAVGGATAGLTAGIGNYMSAPATAAGTTAKTFSEKLAAAARTSGENLATTAAKEAAQTAGTEAATTAAQTGFPEGFLAAPPAAAPSFIDQSAQYLSTAPGMTLAATSALPAFTEVSEEEEVEEPEGLPPFDPTVFSNDYLYGVGGTPPPGQTKYTNPLSPRKISAEEKRRMANNRYAYGGEVGLGASPQEIMTATEWGYVNARNGGSINGPGSGTSDDIPAMLSDGEHVIDAQTVSDAGRGSNNIGQEVVEGIKQKIRNRAGRKNPRSPTSSKGVGLGSLGVRS